MNFEGIEWVDNNSFKCYCPFHNDKANPETKHAIVFINTGWLSCFHCGAVKLNKLDLLNYTVSGESVSSSTKQKPILRCGAGSMRYSAISPRQHSFYKNRLWDGFNIYNPSEGFHSPCGILLRKNSNKKAYLWGSNGIIINPSEYHSTPDDPLHVVEGVYDMLTSRFVAVNGMLTSSTLKYFFMQSIILIPDGDVWNDPTKTKTLVKTIKEARKSNSINLVGLWVLPYDKDPDIVKDDEIEKLSDKDIPKFLRKLNV